MDIETTALRELLSKANREIEHLIEKVNQLKASYISCSACQCEIKVWERICEKCASRRSVAVRSDISQPASDYCIHSGEK